MRNIKRSETPVQCPWNKRSDPDEEEQMEVEMEDIFEEPVMDIDSCDAKNPLAWVPKLPNFVAIASGNASNLKPLHKHYKRRCSDHVTMAYLDLFQTVGRFHYSLPSVTGKPCLGSPPFAPSPFVPPSTISSPIPTPYVFMRRYLKAAQSNRKLELLSFFLMELCFVEYETLKFAPSFLAAAAIYTAQCTLYGFKQ
ncbi:hypothetical protein LOK49_LG04G00315 [Camellia lanceoleosa]|uniref:Uncharacterized protein n=1 Tax=Camellia lanceoleosa TaxID=1840588 RepID=A0ACC0HW40_9ERIC|nr:hypothetical protein LOK49_LG04G00315 [Camellia lanceoleosa]